MEKEGAIKREDTEDTEATEKSEELDRSSKVWHNNEVAQLMSFLRHLL